MTSAVHHTILLFIYMDGSRSIFGGSDVFSVGDLKFLFVLFPFGLFHGQFPTFASDFAERFLGTCSAGVVCGSVMLRGDARGCASLEARGSEGARALEKTPLVSLLCACARPLFFVPPRVIRRVKCDLLFGFHLAS